MLYMDIKFKNLGLVWNVWKHWKEMEMKDHNFPLQQGGNSRIPYLHVPAARMSILIYVATAINTFLFL